VHARHPPRFRAGGVAGRQDAGHVVQVDRHELAGPGVDVVPDPRKSAALTLLSLYAMTWSMSVGVSLPNPRRYTQEPSRSCSENR
jgi:hypothetical protein